MRCGSVWESDTSDHQLEESRVQVEVQFVFPRIALINLQIEHQLLWVESSIAMADDSKPVLKDDFKIEYAKSARSAVS